MNVQYYIDGKVCCRKNVIGVSHSKKKKKTLTKKRQFSSSKEIQTVKIFKQ